MSILTFPKCFFHSYTRSLFLITNFFGGAKNFLRSEINYNQNNIFIRPSTTLCAEKNIVEAIKKFRSFFFANLEFLGKKTCVRTSRRASFEDSL